MQLARGGDDSVREGVWDTGDGHEMTRAPHYCPSLVCPLHFTPLCTSRDFVIDPPAADKTALCGDFLSVKRDIRSYVIPDDRSMPHRANHRSNWRRHCRWFERPTCFVATLHSVRCSLVSVGFLACQSSERHAWGSRGPLQEVVAASRWFSNASSTQYHRPASSLSPF